MSATAAQLLFSAKFPFRSPPPVKRPSQREREYLHDTRAIQDYLGHKNIHYTVRYTQISPQRFESFWTD